MNDIILRMVIVPLFAASLLGVNISPIVVSAQPDECDPDFDEVCAAGSTPSAEWTWTPSSPSSTGCDGLEQLTFYHKPTGSTTNNLVIYKLSAPVVKVVYSNPADGTIIDQPGIGGCSNNFNPPSFQIHGPETHAIGLNIPTTKLHVRYFVGATCDAQFPNNIPYACYKYEQLYYMYDKAGSALPRLKHQIVAFGVGYVDIDTPPPVYSAYFRVDTNIPTSAEDDKFQRKTGSSTWGDVTGESFTPLTKFSNSGAQWRTCTRTSTGPCSTEKITVTPATNDNPQVWVLKFDPTDPHPEDPTNNQQQNNEPSIWANCSNCINPANILFWYKTNRQATSTSCTPTNPCFLGPTLTLQGGL
jgi:hypothetical protein